MNNLNIRLLAAVDRLERIKDIIDTVDKRILLEGPAAATLREMTPGEISEIYALAATPFVS